MTDESMWGDGEETESAFEKQERLDNEKYAKADKAIAEGRYHDLDNLDDDEETSADADVDVATNDEDGIEKVMSFQTTTEVAKAASDAAFREQLAEAERLSPDYQPPPPPLTREEEAAQRTVEMMKTGEWDKFAETLREANQKLRDDAAVARGELERDEDGVVVAPTPKFNPMTLDSKAFESFTRAAQRGGTDPRDIPAGWTYDSWTKAVEGVLEGGIER